MGQDVLLFPFLFIALFFESFLLVTFLSKPARESRLVRRASSTAPTPNVAIIVPVWNEETTIAGTVESLLALDYPADKLSLILVNDGSTDGTPAVVDRFAAYPQVIAIHKGNGGKFTAMNIGIEHANGAELVGFLDADSFVAPDALREIVAEFTEPGMMAVTASMSIHAPKTLLQRMQYAEYTLAITLRHAFASINSLYVTPGPFSFYRRSVFNEIGLFKHAHLAEDMEMAMRMQRAGLRIGNAVRARVYTKGPSTFPKLIKQRTRWTTGFLRNVLFEYRDLLGTKQNAALGMFILPLGLVSVAGGIIIFAMSVTELIRGGLHALSVVRAAPLSYTMAWHPFTWFYLPLTATALIGLMLTVSILAWMAVGKYFSRTPGTLAVNLAVYMLLYGIVAPLWLIRSVSDVALNANTPWR